MMSKILVTYASKHGSTAEIAATIGAILRERDHQVDVIEVSRVNSLRPYSLVILGSAVYSNQWMEEALNFLQTHHLSDVPIYLFSSGAVRNLDEEETRRANTLPESVQKLSQNLQIREFQAFHGKLDLRKLSLAELTLFNTAGEQTGDFREWDRIKLWAQHISDTLVRG